MKADRDGWGGVAFWCLALTILAYLGTKHIWFDAMSRGEKAIFWTNVAVAAGTLALAFVTYWNVRQTNKVVSSEERRHQQSFAPLVELNIIVENKQMVMTLTNLGAGLALAVYCEVVVHGVIYETVKRVLNHAEAAELTDAEGSEFVSFHEDEGWVYERTRSDFWTNKYWLGRTSIGARRTIEVLRAPVQWDFHAEPVPLNKRPFAKITYTDMFNNPYETIYEFDLGKNDWRRPEALKF